MKSRISMFLFWEHSSRSTARPAKLVRGMPRAPKANKIGLAASKSKTGRAAIRRNAILEKHAKQLHVRMSQDELERARRLASSLGMTLSDCVRVLLQLPAPTVQQGGASLIVVDRGTAVGIRRELRRWATTTTRPCMHSTRLPTTSASTRWTPTTSSRSSERPA